MKNIEFSITVADIDWVDTCVVLGTKLNYFSVGGRKRDTASFDRKNPEKGYVKGNVFVISNYANMKKSDMNIEQLERMLSYARN